MDVFISLIISIFEEGFIYGIMAIGVYITYKVLDFPDLTVDGSFPLGTCFTGLLISVGVDPWIACVLSFLAGAVAGGITGILHVKFKVTNLLSGILVMTALWSINLVITNGSAVLSFFNKPTIFNSGIGSLFTGVMSDYKVLIMAGVLVILVKIIIDLYLKTKSGLLLRASGSNPQFVTSLGRDSGKMKVLGLAIGNGLTALSGSILGQQSGSANINSGTGMVVMALASVIIGTTLFKKITIMKATTAVILGSILYKACLSIAMLIGLPTNYLKLLMAGIFAVVLISNNMLTGRRKKVYDNTKK